MEQYRPLVIIGTLRNSSQFVSWQLAKTVVGNVNRNTGIHASYCQLTICQLNNSQLKYRIPATDCQLPTAQLPT